MEGNGSSQDQDQETDPVRSQLLRGGFLAGPKPHPHHLLFASEKHQEMQHHTAASPPPAAADASLSLFFPTTHQPHDQSNDTDGATYSSSGAHKPTIAAAPPPPPMADQMDIPPGTTTTTRFRWMRELFSFGQWQELELQALIYKYMLAGASIPMELIIPIKRSLLTKAALDQHHNHDQQYPFASQLLQAGGYWGRCAMDPEPGRCRRTDGKKWRCSREVMAGRRYCERHALRGKNRSRKLVEAPSPPAAAAVPGVGGTQGSVFPSGMNTMPMLRESGLSSVPSPSAMGMGGSHEQRPPSSNHRMITTPGRCLPESYPYPTFLSHDDGLSSDANTGRVLRHFFDDWPRASHQAPYSNTPSVDKTVTGPHHHPPAAAAASALSISAPPESHPSSDFCLKLYTGSSDKCGPGDGGKDKLSSSRFVLGEEEQQQHLALQPLAWPGLGRQMEEASMGGPLAEALGGSGTSVPSHPGMPILQRPM